MKKRNVQFELSQIRTPLAAFLESYNLNIPKGFPRVTVSMLEKFQLLYPALFKKNNLWSVARHRKRLMDWLSTNRA